MKEIIKITLGLTITCLFAAFVMGSVYIITAKAKKHNEHLNFQETMLGMLGYDNNHPAPDDLNLNNVYRYLLKSDNKQCLGYLIPVLLKNKIAYKFVIIDIEGKFIKEYDLKIKSEEVIDNNDRLKAVQSNIDEANLIYADTFITAKIGKKRLAYLLPGQSPGFKTAINFMLALDANYKILGLEIIDHQEDPGLGAEIEQEYFKNQFKEKKFKNIKSLKVVKEPLPDDYRLILEESKNQYTNLKQDRVTKIRDSYKEKDIYAITGATISSVAVTSGVRNTLKKFAYRLNVLDKIIAERKLNIAF